MATIGYHGSMNHPLSFPGFVRHGFRHRLLVSLDAEDARFISEEAARLGIEAALVVRMLAREGLAMRRGGDLSTPRRGQSA